MAPQFPPVASPTGANASPKGAASHSSALSPSQTPTGTRIAWPHVALGVAGIGAGLWAVHLHSLVMQGKETGCGISETISCDKVLGSTYGAPFGIPLGFLGALFWVIVLLSSFSGPKISPLAIAWQRLGIASVGLVTSLGLAYVSLGVLRHFCPVCATTHVLSGLNFLVAVGSVSKLRGQTGARPVQNAPNAA